MSAIYTEFPGDEIIAVHFKTKDKPPTEPPGDQWKNTCGMFENVPLPGLPIGGPGIFVFEYDALYWVVPDNNPGHDPKKPWMYFPIFRKYIDSGTTVNYPWVWGAPGSFTVNYIGDTSKAAFRIRVYRNVNIQAFMQTVQAGNPEPPDYTVDGTTTTIDNISATEIYVPFFIVDQKPHPWLGGEYPWSAVVDPHITVQAHCEKTTVGALPPQPPGMSASSPWFRYPTPGSTDLPVRPPPTLDAA
jgi:hypothetical protein